MNELVFLKDKEPRIKTRDMWKAFGYNTHFDLKRVIINNKSMFEERGVYVLEKTKPLQGTKGGRPDESFLLNERQFMLLIMLVKNTTESIDLKSRVEKEFFRLREELAKIARPNIYLDAIRKDLLLDAPQEWVKLYPTEFYDALTALYGQKITDPRYRPSYCGTITRKWIYEIILPKELLNEIDENQKEEKKHTWFNNEGGRLRLARQIEAVTMLARISQGRKDFESRCATMFCGAPLQLSVFL
jgi:phage regulator Rha-like protein